LLRDDAQRLFVASSSLILLGIGATAIGSVLFDTQPLPQ